MVCISKRKPTVLLSSNFKNDGHVETKKKQNLQGLTSEKSVNLEFNEVTLLSF